MAVQKTKKIFICSSCGNESVKWYGQCPACKEWNTFVEYEPEAETKNAKGWSAGKISPEVPPERLDMISTDDEIRFATGFSELDRVLGGGAVKGSLVLIGGEPGVGKSTLMLQICRSLSQCAGKVLYASGEESKRQLKLRADRLEVSSGNILILAETRLEAIFDTVEKEQPDVLVVDSIQTVYKSSLSAAPGNVTQIRDCTMSLLQLAKSSGIVVFIVGHVNKDGELAGPKIMEHMVDCVLYFEGERQNAYRVLRAAKNRFGSTNEVGIFEMGQKGLSEVVNPSEAMLSGRPEGAPGSCVTCTMEGTRPILAEIQSLVAKSVYGNPRRMASGVDYNRAMLLLAVLEKRAGLPIGAADAYINVIGGLRIDEPASDLAIAVSIASSCRDKAVRSDTAVFGEVGLTGELRRVNALEQRLNEVARLNIRRVVCPEAGGLPLKTPEGLEIITVRNLREAIGACLEQE
ncbi:MAG: DNA repair protein RadA [Clostridia bacterium]|nr:DNA repair protein RadA [Clostridia bacterium]